MKQFACRGSFRAEIIFNLRDFHRSNPFSWTKVCRRPHRRSTLCKLTHYLKFNCLLFSLVVEWALFFIETSDLRVFVRRKRCNNSARTVTKQSLLPSYELSRIGRQVPILFNQWSCPLLPCENNRCELGAFLFVVEVVVSAVTTRSDGFETKNCFLSIYDIFQSLFWEAVLVNVYLAKNNKYGFWV